MKKIMKSKGERDKRLAFSIKSNVNNVKNKELCGKLFIIMALFIMIANVHLVYSIDSIDSSGWSGSVLDPIIDGSAKYSTNVASLLADTVIQLLSLAFSPNFFTLMGTENPTLVYGTVSKQVVKESYFFSTVFGLGQMLGVIIATILLFVNAFMLIIGKENQIRDNPVVLFIRYIVSLTAVFLSFDIVYSVIMSIDEIWSQYVFRGYTSIYAGQSFYQVETSRIFTQEPDTEKLTIWGASLNIGLVGIWKAVITGISILLIWKLIKSVFRLFLEVAERYFVLMVLCAFFPVAVATYTCNTTKNIFFSYLRMFFCQAFVMLANIAFMKFFLYVLFNGGWLSSLTNYICALAFVRVAQRLDSYMMAMGLNVAQTGSGILGAIGGAGIGLTNMFRGANNVRKNIGKSLIGMGISQNNADLFKAGAKLGLSGDTLIRGLVPTDTSFENAVSRYSGINSQGFTATKEPGDVSSANTDANDAWLRNTLKENGIPTTDIDKLKNMGIDPCSIIQVEKDQRTGAVGYNDEKGAVATSYKGEMYSNKMREQEMAYNENQAKISQEYDTTLAPGQSMSEADAARIAYGMGDLNTDVSHVNLDTLNSLYAGDYDSLEAIPASKREQSEMLNGNESPDVIPYGMDSVGHSRIQFRGRYMDQMNPKTDDFFVDMYNIAQHPDTLKNQGQAGWHFVKQGDEGFMVHDNRHTASDRPSVVGRTSPNYQKVTPNLNHPDNHIEAKKPTADTSGKDGNSGSNAKSGNGGNSGSNAKSGKDGNSGSNTSSQTANGIDTTLNVGDGSGNTPKTPKPSAEPTAFSTTTAVSGPASFVGAQQHTAYESVDDAYERIYGSGTVETGKDRDKGAERRESTKKDKERINRGSYREEKPKSGNGSGKGKGKGKGKGTRRDSRSFNKNIPIDYEEY